MVSAQLRRGRFSRLLSLQLATLYVTRMAHVHRILDEIVVIETHEKAVSGAKQPAQFTQSPLKGLWHQHWFEPQFLAQNLINDLRSGEADRLLAEMSEAANCGHDISRFAYDLIIRRYEGRYIVCKMTGEWIVFAKVDDINYFLTLAFHQEGRNRREGDLKIFERARSCLQEFPEIADCLNEGQC